MKKILGILALVFISFSGFSQTGNGDTRDFYKALNQFILRETKIDSVNRDTSLANNPDQTVPSVGAIKAYVQNRSSGGADSTVYQTKFRSDTARSHYLDSIARLRNQVAINKDNISTNTAAIAAHTVRIDSASTALAAKLSANQEIVVTATGDATGTSTSSGTAPSLPLVLATVNSNVGSFTNANITVDGKGRVTAAANGTSSSGTVTNIVTAAPITGGTITSTGTIGLDTSTINGATTIFTSKRRADSTGLADSLRSPFSYAYPLATGSIGVGTSIIVGFISGGGTYTSGSFFDMFGRYSNRSVRNLAISSTAARKAYYQLSNFQTGLTSYPLVTDAYFNNVRVNPATTPTARYYNTAMAGMRAMGALQWLQNIQFPYTGTSGALNANITLSTPSGWAAAGSEAILLDYGSRTYWYRHNDATLTGSNQIIKTSVTANETITWSKVIGSAVAIATWGTDSVTNNWSRIEYSVDGNIIGTYNPNLVTFTTNIDGGTTTGIQNDAIVITGLKDTTHIITLKFLDAGKKTVIDYVGGLMPTYTSKAVPFYIMDAYHMSNAASLGYNFPGGVTTQVTMDSASLLVRANMAATFPGYAIVFVQTNKYYDPSSFTDVQALDGIHPTVVGQTKIFQAIKDLIGNYPINYASGVSYAGLTNLTIPMFSSGTNGLINSPLTTDAISHVVLNASYDISATKMAVVKAGSNTALLGPLFQLQASASGFSNEFQLNAIGGIDLYGYDGTTRTRRSTWTNGGNYGIGTASDNNPRSSLTVNGSYAPKASSISTTTTLDSTYSYVYVDATAGNITINLPAISTCANRCYFIKKIDATTNTVTIDASGSETIEGGLTKVLTNQNQSINIQNISGGTSWYVLTTSTINTPSVVASADLTAQTAATNIVTYTTGAADSTFEISARLNITAITAGTLQAQVTYFDENNVSRTVAFFSMGSTTAGISAIGYNNYAVLGELRVKASTTITVSTLATVALVSATYNAGATIKKVR